VIVTKKTTISFMTAMMLVNAQNKKIFMGRNTGVVFPPGAGI
jgi:hypothetical protein